MKFQKVSDRERTKIACIIYKIPQKMLQWLVWGASLHVSFPDSRPLADQGRHITRLRSLRLDQDKLHLALEVRSFPSSTMPVGPFRRANQSNQVLRISDMRG